MHVHVQITTLSHSLVHNNIIIFSIKCNNLSGGGMMKVVFYGVEWKHPRNLWKFTHLLVYISCKLTFDLRCGGRLTGKI